MKWVGLTEEEISLLHEDGECEIEEIGAVLLRSQLPNFEKVVAGVMEDVVYLAGRTYKIGVKDV